MIKLLKSKYSICKRLKTEKVKFSEAYSVISGSIEGDVFVDNREHPVIGIVYSKSSEKFYLLGNLSDKRYFGEIKNRIAFSIMKFAQENKLSEIHISADGAEGNERIEDLFSTSSFTSEINLLSETCYLEKREIEYDKADYKMIDSKADYRRYKNHHLLEAAIEKFWGDIKIFDEFGKCGIVAKADEIIAMFMTTTFHKKRVQVKVINFKTIADQEMLYKLGYKTIRSIRKEGLFPHWECKAKELNLVDLGEKLGFVYTNKFTNYVIKC